MLPLVMVVSFERKKFLRGLIERTSLTSADFRVPDEAAAVAESIIEHPGFSFFFPGREEVLRGHELSHALADSGWGRFEAVETKINLPLPRGTLTFCLEEWTYRPMIDRRNREDLRRMALAPDSPSWSDRLISR